MNRLLILSCPVCKKNLKLINRTFKCVNNHSYDLAKEGYVNLYHNQGRNSGDDIKMLKARKTFLEKGYFKGISNVLNEYIYQETKKQELHDINILDVGCGEGYYLSQLKQSLNNKPLNDFDYYGFDIAKQGIHLAAKRNKDIHWFVANGNNIPLEDNSIDYFINMFSYFNLDEIKRVLKKSGQAIIFRAGKHHLIELKEILYDELYLKESLLEMNHPDLLIEKQFCFNSKITLEDRDDIQHLLLMTPHYWKTKKDNKELLNQVNKLTVTLDIIIYIIKNK